MSQRRIPMVTSPTPVALCTNRGLPACDDGSARLELASTMKGTDTLAFHCVVNAYVPPASRYRIRLMTCVPRRVTPWLSPVP